MVLIFCCLGKEIKNKENCVYCFIVGFVYLIYGVFFFIYLGGLKVLLFVFLVMFVGIYYMLN